MAGKKLINRIALPGLFLLVTIAVSGQRKSTGDSELDGKINQALDQGTKYLVSILPQQSGGQLALVLFAALEGGADKKDPLVKAAMQRALELETGQTYTAGVLLMLYQKHYGKPARKAIVRVVKNLISWQEGDGGWGYGVRNSRSDASNTQYALLGIRAAVMAGWQIKSNLPPRAVKYLLNTRGIEGGFSYTNRRSKPSDTMTAGTLGSLVICRELAGRKGLGKGLEKKVKAASRLGVWWLARRFNKSLPPGRNQVGMRTGYFLYALERAMILMRLEELEKINWYTEGARYLVNGQMANGSWGMDAVTSAFAVLFLGRTFKGMNAFTVDSPEKALLMLKRSASSKAIKALAATLTSGGLKSVPACLKVLRGNAPKQRLAAVLALRGITGLEPGFDPDKSPTTENNQRAARIWERWWMQKRTFGKGQKSRAR